MESDRESVVAIFQSQQENAQQRAAGEVERRLELKLKMAPGLALAVRLR